jgi:GAF domain-containing protein/two-component sensor histidine kinase
VNRLPAARRAAGILVAAAAAVAIVPVKLAVNGAIGQDIGFIPAIAAVVLAAWLGGFVPGIVATAVGMVAEAVVFMEPRGSLALDGDRLRLVLFGLTGVLASWLAWLRTRAETQARAAGEDANRARDRADLNARRVGALQGLARELAGAATTEQITDAILNHGMTALRAGGGAVFTLDAGGAVLTAVAWRGYDPERAAAMRRLPLTTPMPATDTARTGEPVFIEDPAAYAQRYGEVVARHGVAVLPRAVAVVPLEVEGRRFGVLGFTWDHPHELGVDRRAFIAAIARLGAAAMDRARLFDAEREALRAAAATQRRLDLLAEAGRVLGITLDYETTLRRLAGLALPLLGDVGIVDVLDEAGGRRLVTTRDAALAGPAAVIESHPLDPDGHGPIADVVRSGRAGVIAIDEQTVAAASRSVDHASALAAIGARWALVAPLRALGRTIGAIAFLRLEDRMYDAEEVALAEELGDRAGRALENARLHSEIGRLAERERRRAAELEAVVGTIREGILVADADGTIRSSNAAAIRLLGGPAGTTAALLGRLRDAAGGEPDALPDSPVEYRLAQRPTSWVEVTSYPVVGPRGGASPSRVVVFRDVTAFRQGQALREAFLGLLSHELRTPVTTIYGGASVLARPGAALDPATSNEILVDIASEADRLYRLVEDLLVLARFDEGFELGDEPVLLQRLVPAIIDQERGRWPAVAFTVETEADLPVARGDETSVTQVLRNLISNAAKYSPPGSIVAIAVEAVREGVRVRVSDEGPGIEPGEAEDLFEPFYRSPSTAKMAGGAGIGLYVSRRLVDAMGGQIGAVRRAEGGSEFWFVLRAYRGRADEDAAG